jgi:hypothetical protein
MILETFPELRELSSEQKMQLSMELAEEAWGVVEMHPGWLEVLDQRLDAYEANPDAVKTTEEVTAGLMSRSWRTRRDC